MKTPEEIKKYRDEVLETLATAKLENIPFWQGVIYGLDYPSLPVEKEDGFTE